MKNFRINKFLIGSILFLICCCCGIFWQSTGISKEVSFASCKIEEYPNETPNLKYDTPEALDENFIPNGHIPFGLFTANKNLQDTGGDYAIRQYKPSFVSVNENGVEKYVMEESSIPYILLSSKFVQGTDGNTDLNYFYQSNLYFKFNDEFYQKQEGEKNRVSFSTIETTIQNSSSSKPIRLATPLTSIGGDPSYEFHLNLWGLETPDFACPQLWQNPNTPPEPGEDGKKKYLGGSGADHDVSQRTGLYTIKIGYSYITEDGFAKNACEFHISFYVIDYSSYIVEGNKSPITISNADLYPVTPEENIKENYYVYNYNYEKSPIITYDATKFALNFTFSLGVEQNHFYRFKFVSFNEELKNGHNGVITLHCSGIGKNYSFFTYDKSETGGYKYEANFNLADFEKDFIYENATKIKSYTYQGIYSFNLGLLIKSGGNSSYTLVNKDLFSQSVLDTLDNQRLLIYGYDLRYKEKNSSNDIQKFLPLVREGKTHTTIFASNNITKDGEFNTPGVLKSIPTAIATTNQAPLEFHNFGDLYLESATVPTWYKAEFAKFDDITELKEQDILTKLSNATTIPELDAVFGSSKREYQQSSRISGNGIWLMKLNYSVNFPVTSYVDKGNIIEEKLITKTTTGTQYILFEINNTIEKLETHTLDENYIYEFEQFTNKAVRIAVEKKENLFYSPVKVTYSRASNYVTNDVSGELYLRKKDDGSYDSYLLNGKEYYYYTINDSFDYSFYNNGKYSVKISNTVNNNSRGYTFTIDRNNFDEVSVNTVSKKDGNNNYYFKEGALTEAANSFYITSEPFTLSWKPKSSGAKQYCYVCKMNLREDSSKKDSLYKENDSSYYLTNGYIFDNVILDTENSYDNSYSVNSNEHIKGNSVFKENGFYYFYIYDNAGNSTSLSVLIDNSMPNILQGKWALISEEGEWLNSYDSKNNPNNITDKETVLYFGTHKAMQLPKFITGEGAPKIYIKSNNYTAYHKDTGEIETKDLSVSIEFYQQLLDNLQGSFIKNIPSSIDLLKNSSTDDLYFLIPNKEVKYNRIDSATQTQSSGKLSKIQSAEIYTITSLTDVLFKGEAEYIFSVVGGNNVTINRYIQINFDKIKGQFYAYNQKSQNHTDLEPHYISKNSATNLDTLQFRYTKFTGKEALFYELRELNCTYYPFQLDPLSYNETSILNYPFVSKESAITFSLLQQKSGEENNFVIIDKINTDTSFITKPGKYVITRVLRGGEYLKPNLDDRVPDTNRDENGFYGGRYTYDPVSQEFIDLFALDEITRQYVIYVDHNQIISKVMLNSHTPPIKETGEHISITLGSDNKENSWEFKDFYKHNSNNRKLITNRVPITINIPISKYFFISNLGTVFCRNTFSKLTAEIKFVDPYGRVRYYTTDGFDENSKNLTCTALRRSGLNDLGKLTFQEEGNYTIRIYDKTGYGKVINGSYNQNISPIEFANFTFEIITSSPYAEGNLDIYSSPTDMVSKKIEVTNNNFGVNVKEKNVDSAGQTMPENKLYITWEDPRTPYLSRINQIKITQNNPSSPISYLIDLTSFGSLSKRIGENLLANKLDCPSFLSQLMLYNYYEESRPKDVFDNKEYSRLKYSLYISLKDEVNYDITFYYDMTSNVNEFSSKTYTITIDRTKPNQNINRLIANDRFLNTYYQDSLKTQFKEETLNINQFKNYPSALSYVFNISKDYKLSYNPNETSNFFYFRPFDIRYSSPSLTPDLIGTEFYKNDVLFGTYPRFSEISLQNGTIEIRNNTWYQTNYTNSTSLYSTISNRIGTLNPNWFYEIIERDDSGNYRTFTIYFSSESNDYKILNFSGADGSIGLGSINKDTQDDQTTSNMTADKFFNMKELSCLLGWGKVEISNITLNSIFTKSNIILSPSNSNITTTLIEEINKFLACGQSTIFSLKLFTSNIICSRTLRIIVPHGEKEIKLPPPEIKEVPNLSTAGKLYNISLPTIENNNLTLYLKAFKLEYFNQLSGRWEEQANYTHENEIPSTIYNLVQGTYRVSFVDNYNSYQYSYNIYVGEHKIEDFNEMYEFDNNGAYLYDEDSDTYYTGGKIKVTYEKGIYKITVNGRPLEETSIHTEPSPTLSSYNCETFTLDGSGNTQGIEAEFSLGGIQYYTVEYHDKTDNSVQKTINFCIYDKLPEINLIDHKTQNRIFSSPFLNKVLNKETNGIVNITWGKLNDSSLPPQLQDREENKEEEIEGNNVTSAILYSSTSEGEFNTGVSITQGYNVHEEGVYKLVLENNYLNNYRVIYFKINFSKSDLYSVFVKDDNNKETQIFPSKWEKLDFSRTENGTKLQDAAEGSLPLVDNIYKGLTFLQDSLSNIVEGNSNKTEYQTLIESLGYSGGVFDNENTGNDYIKNIRHYYSVKKPIVQYNSNVELNIIEFYFENNNFDYDNSKHCYIQTPETENPTPSYSVDYYCTTVYLIYNFEGAITIELFAVTKVPNTTNLLDDTLYYTNERDVNFKNMQHINLNTIEDANSKILTNKEIPEGPIILAWNSLRSQVIQNKMWYNQGNQTIVYDKYGLDTEFEKLDVKSHNDKNYAVISKSGQHNLLFMDVAGNQQVFKEVYSGYSPEIYTLYFISELIYSIKYNNKETNPIQYGIFNDEVKIIISSLNNKFNLKEYSINVTCNGTQLTNQDYSMENIPNGEKILTFNRPGKYIVRMVAKHGDSDLNPAVYNFSLLYKDSAKTAFEYPEIKGYQILKVIRNGLDITHVFTGADNKKSSSLFISSGDEKSGNGYYTVTLKYGNNASDTLNFSFLINDFIPTISCNVPHGETTKGDIEITYNPSFIYSQLGECFINILAFNDHTNRYYLYKQIPINSTTAGSQASYTIKENKSYCIQVKTASGNTVSSFTVNKVAPLNTVAIIIIVISSIAFIALIFIIVKLRTRMRVR